MPKTYTITQEQMDRLHGAAQSGAILGGKLACLKMESILAEIAFKERLNQMKEPPWTDEEVKNLNKWQEAGDFHPFTCPNCPHDTNLVATNNGWICKHCDYTQDWAHGFMIKKD